MAARKVYVVAAVAAVLTAGLATAVNLAVRDGGQTAGGAPQQERAAREPADPKKALAEAGQTPEATIRAYYYYKDRGLLSKMRPLLAQDSVELVTGPDRGAMSDSAQALRGIVVDHVDAGETEATVYFRSWYSLATRARGGRPYALRLVMEDGSWKVSVPISLQLTVGIKKGKDDHGFYDGTAEWWK